MKLNMTAMLLVLTATFGVCLTTIAYGAEPPDGPKKASEGGTETSGATDEELPTLEEARGRAKLLHETIHATLQVVHHQYYREDEGLLIPARTLKAVFEELARSQNVKVRWLAVDAQAMNVDHKPQDAFEKNAVKALKSGKEEFEFAEGGEYRHAGTITLSSECLKCHLPYRTSTKDRAAGLVISMQVKKK